MDMATALAELGVTERTLDAATKEQLDRNGYAPLPGVLSDEQVRRIRARLAELMATEGDRAGLEVHQEAGTDRLADLVNKDRSSRSALPIRGCWPVSPMCLATSSCPRSTAALPSRARATRHCTPRADRWAWVPIRCATRSGCWTISARTTARHGWCPAPTGSRCQCGT